MKEIERKSTTINNLEYREGEKIEEILRRKFVDENKQIMEIANELQISYPTVCKTLKLAGIYSRMLKLR